ncbi:MAG: alkaline phosphatase family protein, partial [Planctomycetales bacterium]|nr:alkaline phosphatase family protein [Planctomycetales bacterium]
CLSVFPSITPAATASLATGHYPAEHGIAGAFWYEAQQARVAYYGDDLRVVLEQGFGNFVSDFLFRLNFERLLSDPVFERVEREGRQAAVLNYMWFRGAVPHQVNAPFLLEMLPGVEFEETVRGPSVLCLGDFVTTQPPGADQPLESVGGFTRRFGFHDEATAEYLRGLAALGPLPEFTLAYFPNNDYESHCSGPEAALAVVEQVDAALRDVMELRGGVDAFLRETAIIITGDHSQGDQFADAAEREICLDQLLSDFALGTTGMAWEPGDDLLVCPNMRAAQIYTSSAVEADRHGELTEALLSDPRVDQIIWRDGEHTFRVKTRDRGELSFSRCTAGQAGDGLTDDYGNRWEATGDLSAVDAAADASGRLIWGDYPNALERITGGFSEVSGSLWGTCLPGTEFRLPETSTHPGGTHGSLHKVDSTSLLIAAGIPDEVEVPEKPRIVDVAPLCLNVLGIKADSSAAQ